MSIRSVVCLSLVLLSAAFTSAQSYTVTDIGVLKGTNESSGLWLNSLGQVVGCSDVSTQGYPCTGTNPGQQAFLWSKNTGLQDLGTLPGGNISTAYGINDAGAVVGYSNSGGAPITQYSAFLWTASGGMVNLGSLPSAISGAAFEINSSGVIVGDSLNSNGIVVGAAWKNNKIRSIGRLPGAIFTAGLDLNDSGEIVGESIFSYGPPIAGHAFTWIPGALFTDLGTLPGGTISIANAVNSSGTVVGQSDGTSTRGDFHAVMWDVANNITDLGTLSGGTYSIAFAINDSGTVVGYGNVLSNAPHAMIWTAATGLKDLNALIPAKSGWVLINANAINSLGQITGYGIKNGHNHAFFLTPEN